MTRIVPVVLLLALTSCSGCSVIETPHAAVEGSLLQGVVTQLVADVNEGVQTSGGVVLLSEQMSALDLETFNAGADYLIRLGRTNETVPTADILERTRTVTNLYAESVQASSLDPGIKDFLVETAMSLLRVVEEEDQDNESD